MKFNFETLIDKFCLFFKRAAYCFSFTIIAMALVGKYLNLDEKMFGMSVDQILTFLLYALLFATSFLIADFIKDNAIIKNAVRFLLSYSSLISIIMFGGSFESFRDLSSTDNPDFSYMVIMSMIFVCTYIIVSLFAMLKTFVVKKLTDSNKEYTSIFSDDDK